MSARIRIWLPWIIATLAVAALVHVGSLFVLPHFVMARALRRLGTPNTMHVGHRPDANARAVVRPSPDLLYAACPFDLSQGPLRVTADVPHDVYWSVSAFDSDTNNFFVRNDQQITGNSLEILILRHGQPLPNPGHALESVILFSPSERGLILIRTLIDNDKHLPALLAMLHRAHCETVAQPRSLR